MRIQRVRRLALLLPLVFPFVACEKVETLRPGEVRTQVVYVSEQHLGFPGATKLSSGEILVVFREGAGHVSRDGRILLCRSSDGGRTWSKPDTILDTPLDDRDPSIVETAGGALLLNFFASAHSEEGEVLQPPILYLSRSYDGGKTWAEPAPIRASGFQWLACSDNILALPTGRLLLPAYGNMEGDTSNTAIVLISDDFGLTWTRHAVVARDSTGRIDYNEPALVLLPDQSILCVLRTARASHWMAIARSTDWGETWTHPTWIDVQGEAADVIRTHSGALVMGYRDFSPHGVSLRLSYDRGRTWENELTLYAGKGDLAYASLVELPQNQLLVFYYVDRSAWRFGYRDKRGLILASRVTVPIVEAPEGLSCSYRDSTTISLRWNRVGTARYYQVYRSNHPDSLGELATFTTENQCLLQVDPGDTLVYLRVVAVQGTNEGLPDYGKESPPTRPVRPRR